MTARSDVLFITDKTKLLKSALGHPRPGRARSRSGQVRDASKAEVISKHERLRDGPLRFDARPWANIPPMRNRKEPIALALIAYMLAAIRIRLRAYKSAP
jgi:hypothetical protein